MGSDNDIEWAQTLPVGKGFAADCDRLTRSSSPRSRLSRPVAVEKWPSIRELSMKMNRSPQMRQRSVVAKKMLASRY
jgi:hypothetical protein